MSRQIINVMYIMKYINEYNISWLFHIDTDEILHLKNSDKKDSNCKNIKIPLYKLEKNNYYNIKIPNYELVPEHENYTNCFLEGIYFKTNEYRYIAYANGKSCVNVKKLKSCVPNGVHDFNTNQNQHTTSDIVVLHFVSCNFSQFLQKYYDLGNFGDKWWNDIPISISFHTQSRDKIVKCEKSKEECEKDALTFYKKTRLLTNDRTKIIKIENIRDILND
jgi:hypothetical protein